MSSASPPKATKQRTLLASQTCHKQKSRLFVSGNVRVEEIERLIKKLELDKQILAEQNDEAAN